jgi:hypothetical protein
MADEGSWVQLATRIPKALHRLVKIHCVTTETTVAAFVVAALEEQVCARFEPQVRRRKPTVDRKVT